MLDKMRNRLRSEQGFTLIELLVVIIILGILLAIAIPSYLSFRDRANNSAAQADIRSAVPAIEAYNADNTTSSGYTGATITKLLTYDSGIYKNLSVTGGTATTYCLSAKIGTGSTYYKNGPGGVIGTAPCS